MGGTFTYAVNGGLTAVHAARLDIVGIVTLAMVSGLGGGIIRDILLGAVPPATFSDGRYLAVAAAGGLAAFALISQLARVAGAVRCSISSSGWPRNWKSDSARPANTGQVIFSAIPPRRV